LEDILDINALVEIEENNENILLEKEDILNIDVLAEVKKNNKKEDVEIWLVSFSRFLAVIARAWEKIE
jgi:hypothetical protein